MTACEQFRAKKKLKLRDEDAGATPLRKGGSKDKAKERERQATEQLIDQLSVCQEMLFASRRHKVLLVLQGMDTSGKDGTLKALFGRVSPVGMRAVAFRAPSEEERAHDFLWRVHRHTPVWGEIVIFNRSHYEDVLVAPVLGEIDSAECKRRYAHIRDFERMLGEQGTTIVKVFLHISSDEQRERLQQRIDDPEKQWKFDPHDIEQRKRWDVPARLRTRDRCHRHRPGALVRGAGRLQDPSQPDRRGAAARDHAGAQAGVSGGRSAAVEAEDRVRARLSYIR
jgi:PPK2 family polyphosphate:nucleotide phosphotransferase